MTTKTPQKNDGGPAFPWGGYLRGGMTLRQYYAGQALVAAVGHDDYGPETDVAAQCFQVADAMIAYEQKED